MAREIDAEMNELIDELVKHEWEFFHNVNNEGGKASCQFMPKTFSVARRAQYVTWSKEAVASWLDDLIAYERAGMNPLTFKYGYMMRTTHPDEYEKIKDMLPEITDEKRTLVDELVDIELSWAEELAQQYPHYAGKGRPIRSASDTEDWTSTETYARSEFSTYSENTLRELVKVYRSACERGENFHIASAAEQARAFGYETLADCDRAIAEGRMSSHGLDD